MTEQQQALAYIDWVTTKLDEVSNKAIGELEEVPEWRYRSGWVKNHALESIERSALSDTADRLFVFVEGLREQEISSPEYVRAKIEEHLLRSLVNLDLSNQSTNPISNLSQIYLDCALKSTIRRFSTSLTRSGGDLTPKAFKKAAGE